MSTSAEELQRMLEWAQQNDDQEAVEAVQAEIARAEGVRPPDPTVPPHMDQDPIETGALPSSVGDRPVARALSNKPESANRIQPEGSPEGALRTPTSEQPWTPEEYERAGALQEDREYEMALAQWRADRELLNDPANRPNRQQWNEFISDATNQQYGASQYNTMQQGAIVDPETGEVRWTAMHPDVMERYDRRGEKFFGGVGEVVGGLTRMPGTVAQNVEAEQNDRNSFQNWLLTAKKGALPASEQKRIMKNIREEYADSAFLEEYLAMPGLVPSNKILEWIGENPDNDAVMQEIAGDERWESWREGWLRRFNRMSAVIPYMPVNVFGADEPIGALSGQGYYEDIEYEEGERAPAYPGASRDLEAWMNEAEHPTGIYEHLVRPIWQRTRGETPGQSMTAASEAARDFFLTEKQIEERGWPLFNPNIEINSLGDMLNWDLYTDPETKINNPHLLLFMFLENAPEMGASFALTRGSGGWAARSSMVGAERSGLTITQLNRIREQAARNTGMLVGGATEGLIVQQHLESETRNILNTIPIEVWRENASFQALTDSGAMSEEDARQILINNAAGEAGTTGALLTMGTGAPMNRFLAGSGAGRLIQDRPWLRRTVGTIGEPLTEGAQETMELMLTEAAVRPVDPDNPIFDNPNRYAETFASGFIVATPMGAASALEPSTPAGFTEEQAEVARSTVNMMEATNERFRFETEITDPEYIQGTAPIDRLRDLERLENLQQAEADAVLEAAPIMRAHLEEQNTATSQAELTQLSRLEMRANAMLTDIAVARSRRTTASEVQQEEQRILQDRAELQRRVNEDVLQLEDINRLAGNIEAVQNQEAINNESADELIREGYARRAREGNLVILPKGKRAIKELNRQARGLQGRLEAGYTGVERRDPASRMKREMIDEAGPAERERMIYQDPLTDAKNRRAFTERQEDIDVKEGQTPRTPSDPQPAVAAVDVDSLAWVNDNMSHSAGDRLLVAVSDAIAKQKGVEVYRLGGDEFAVTGASEAVLEEALQRAAKDLAKQEIAAGQDVVTPTITWGKGQNYEQADNQSIQMKEDRQARGIVAQRKKQPASYRNRAQQGLFMRDDGTLPRGWQSVKNVAERGDSVEVLTPDGAVQGVVTNVSNRRGRPRVRVDIQGRSFLFNPDNNHLIVSNTDPADIAWLTGEAEYAQPDRPTMPQIIPEVQLGHLGKDGYWYADLSQEYQYEPVLPWWMNDDMWAGGNWDSKVFGVRPMPVASEAEMAEANTIAANLTAGYNNLPEIHMVESWDQLERDAPDIVAQIRSEGGSATGVRGYMDHIGHSGIYVFVPNISGIAGSQNFAQSVAETIMHEMIGHYGVRGFFGDELDLRMWMNDTVDMFPQLAKFYAQKLGLNPAIPSDKQLLGEEMVAYIAGEVYSGKVDLTKKQQGFWNRLVNWFKSIIIKRGWNRWAPVKKMVTLNDTKADFWNNERIVELLSRAQDFVRNGKGFEWRAINEASLLYQRDGDIFQSGVVTAINTGTKKLSRNERNQMKGKYGGDINNVPKETALFPDNASPNAYKQAVIAARKAGFMTDRDLELSGLSENSDFYLFRDATYATLKKYHEQMNGGTAPQRWYQGVLPGNLAKELDDINDAMEKNWIEGPIQEFESRPIRNKVSDEAMRNRIDEILDQTIDPKKTRLSKELLLAHMASENVFRVYAMPAEGHLKPTYSETIQNLFGDLTDQEIDAMTEEQIQQVKDEQERAQTRGPFVGYDAEQDRWIDNARQGGSSYAGWAPQGSRYTRDYREVLIKTEGRGGEMGRGQHAHFNDNLMHIRTGEAELLNDEMFEGMEWPNPEMRGKLLSLIELQSDWLQSLRKGFTSGNERDAAEQAVREDRHLLNMVGDQFGLGVGEDMWSAIHDQLRPVINLPSDGRGDRRGSLMSAMSQKAVDNVGAPWDQITDEQRLLVWKEMVNEQLETQLNRWRNTIEMLEEYNEELPKLTDLPGSVDIRAFETLDAVAVRRVVNVLRQEAQNVVDHLSSAVQYASNQAELVERVNTMQGSVSRRLSKLATGSEYVDTQRLPMTEYMLKPILERMYSRIKADPARVAERIGGLVAREQATVRVPIQPLLDLNTAMRSTFEPKHLLEEMVSGSRITRHSDIPPGSLVMTPVDGGDGFMDIKVIGNKADVQKAKDLVPKLMKTWVENHAQEKLDIQRRNSNRPVTSQGLRDHDEYTYSDMESFLGLDESDTREGDQDTRAYGVTTYMEFEENEIGEIESRLIDEAFDNISEDEWNQLDSDHPGVGREGDEYREALNIDEDGDVDNDDAEDALREARDEYRREVLWEDEDLRMQAYDEVNELWEERGPTALIMGSVPIEWDSDGDPTDYVSIQIIAQNPGDAYDINIDGEEYNYDSNINDAKDLVAEAVYDYYNNEDIVPPPGTEFGPDKDARDEFVGPPPPVVNPNWDVVESNLSENVAMMSDASQKLTDVFERLVTNQKKLDAGGVYKNSPLSKDEQWRPIALKYLIADAVRRGLGGVMWNNGLSGGARGGWDHNVQGSDRITWSKELMTTRGVEQEVYVIHQPNYDKPIVVAKNRMVPILGMSVTRMINQQEAGKLDSPEVTKREDEDKEVADPRDNYLIAPTGADHLAVYRRSDNEFLGFVRDGDEDALQTKIQEDLRHYGSSQIPDRPRVDREGSDDITPMGRIIARGTITREMAGGQIYVAGRGRTRGYRHTFAQPRELSARQSYEEITPRLWNKELKKYGVQIMETYVKAKDMQTAVETQGQQTLITSSRDEKIADDHGRLYIAETEGPMHHWVVMSANEGPIVNDVFTTRQYAQEALDRYIKNNYGDEREGVKVMYFPITEQMREEFSGPVAPFHMDPDEDPDLKSAMDKIGPAKRESLRDRVKKFRMGIGAEMRQGMVDQFYGLRRALTQAGEGDGAYISARLTTSLDSMMKAVLFNGNPIWRDGIMQTEGRGLMEVLQPILNDPKRWGAYMAGTRAKGLMLEGYDKLSAGDKKLVDKAASHFDGDIIKAMAFIADYDPAMERDPGETRGRRPTRAERRDIRNLETKLDLAKEAKAGRFVDRDGRRQPREWVEQEAADLTEKLQGMAQRAAPPSEGFFETVQDHLEHAQIQLDPDMWIERLEGRIADIESQFAPGKKKPKRWAKRDDGMAALEAYAALIDNGREHLFTPREILKMTQLGDRFGHFKKVAKDYAEFNRKMLDFAEKSGIIDPEGRKAWESADYVPFYRVNDDRLAGSGMSPTNGIANQRAPIRRLRGADKNIGDIIGNIMMNTAKLVDASVKNNAALEAIDALKGSGIIGKKPLDWKPAVISMKQVEKVLIDRGVIVPDDSDQPGMKLKDIPDDALEGFQKMFAINAPKGDGIVSVMRDGKREYYYTEDMLLYRSLGAINKKNFGNWINLFRAPKRLVTQLITIDPAFMLANFIRDTGSSFVIGRDKGNMPVLSALKGFSEALLEDETYRTMLAAGAAFESGYTTGGDPREVKKIIKEAMKSRGFIASVINTPRKAIRAWMHLGSSIENSNRIAIYNAAIKAGKSKKRAAYEAKDLMDFSMGGDWGVVQFLIQTVPFMNARLQGMYRLGRGAVEHPVSFTVKGMLVGLAGFALYSMFKDDERYKELPMWDRHAYFHWWIGDQHYRLPKPFEVGAIFNTIPEMFANYHNSEETDAGRVLLREFGHMISETFSMNPIPQTVAPLVESGINYNFFRDAPIVSFYEQKRLPPDQYRYRTSPFMIELAQRLPSGLDTATMGRIRSPLHLQNLWTGYTGTIGRYMLQGADMMTRSALDYPIPPAMEDADIPVWGRFVRGDGTPRVTKYEAEVYNLLNITGQIQGSLAFHERQGNVEQYLATHEEYGPYIRAASTLESVREDIQDVNRAIQQIYLNPDMEPQQKTEEINLLEETRNTLFREAYKLRPGGEYNPLDQGPPTQSQIIDMIDNYGVDNSTAFMRNIEENAPDTAELLEMIADSSPRALASLARQTGEE